MVGAAVKVTEVPAQIAPVGLAEILTVAATLVVTDMVIVFDVAGLPVLQGVALEVISTVMVFALARDVDV